jgi:hypothetical protein
MNVISTAFIIPIYRVLKAHNCEPLRNTLMAIVLRNLVTMFYFVSLYTY